MPVLYVRLTIMCALCAAIVGLAVTSDWQTESTVQAASRPEWACAPCGTPLPTSTELVTIAGMRWAVCSEACAHEVASAPARFESAAIE